MLLFVITDFQSKQHNLLIISQTTYFSNKISEYNPKNRTNFRNIIQKVCMFQKNTLMREYVKKHEGNEGNGGNFRHFPHFPHVEYLRMEH